MDYLEGLRLEFWGKRDVWAWLVGTSAGLSVLGALGTLFWGFRLAYEVLNRGL